jgi:CHASE3 domain sensor protein
VVDEALRERQRRAVRRTSIVLVLVALAIYVGFILMSIHRSRHG